MDGATARIIVRNSNPIQLFEGKYYDALDAVLSEQRDIERQYGRCFEWLDDHDIMLCAAAFEVGRSAGVREERERRKSSQAKHNDRMPADDAGACP